MKKIFKKNFFQYGLPSHHLGLTPNIKYEKKNYQENGKQSCLFPTIHIGEWSKMKNKEKIRVNFERVKTDKSVSSGDMQRKLYT